MWIVWIVLALAALGGVLRAIETGKVEDATRETARNTRPR